jgi:hypothetical protein
MIMRDEKPFISSDELDELSGFWLSRQQKTIFSKIKLIPEDFGGLPLPEALQKWYEWEIVLRNSITRLRAKKMKKDPALFCMPEKDSFSEIERAVREVSSASDPLRKEKIFYDLRWNRLEDIESGHKFDFDVLCLYKIKLMLREKWLDRKKDAGTEQLDKIVHEVYSLPQNENEKK